MIKRYKDLSIAKKLVLLFVIVAIFFILAGDFIILHIFTQQVISQSNEKLSAPIDKDSAFLPVRKLSNILFAAFFLSVLLVILVAKITAGIIIKPILKLIAITKEISNGEFTKRVQVDSRDEIGELADSFNHMAETLINSMEALELEKAYSEKIISSMTDALIVFNTDSQIRFVNKACLDLLGYEEAELFGYPARKIFREEEIIRGYFQTILEHGRIYNAGATFFSKQGKTIPVNINGVIMRRLSCPKYNKLADNCPEYVKKGIHCEKMTGILMLARDMRVIMSVISDLGKKDAALRERSENLSRMNKAMLHIMEDLHNTKLQLENTNNELQELNRLKSHFVSAVSHELRTPLSIMKEFTSIVADEIPGALNESQKEYVGIVQSNIDRLSRLINDLLNISCIEAGKIKLRKEIINLNDLVNNVVFSLKQEADSKQLEIKLSFPIYDVNIYADADRMIEIFTNLIENAIKFTREKGLIVVEIIDRDNEIECSVVDNGVGIAPENIDKLFEKFQQLDRQIGAGAKGTGLGLAITKELVLLHHGRIWADSKLGAGSKFSFILPKYSSEEILIENIADKIVKSKEESRGLLVFIFVLDIHEDKNAAVKEELKQVCSIIMEALGKIIKGSDFVVRCGENEFVVLGQINVQDAPGMVIRVKRMIKESIFEITQEREEDFSYGYSIYPFDAQNAKGLLEKAHSNMISEKKERLKKSIMIVDDDPVVLRTLGEILRGFGYSNIIFAADGKEAIAKLKNGVPGLIIIDLLMPVMGGYELIGRLKEYKGTKDVPLLIISGAEKEIEKLKEYSDKKAIPIVNKPFNVAKIKKLVDYLL